MEEFLHCLSLLYEPNTKVLFTGVVGRVSGSGWCWCTSPPPVQAPARTCANLSCPSSRRSYRLCLVYGEQEQIGLLNCKRMLPIEVRAPSKLRRRSYLRVSEVAKIYGNVRLEGGEVFSGRQRRHAAFPPTAPGATRLPTGRETAYARRAQGCR